MFIFLTVKLLNYNVIVNTPLFLQYEACKSKEQKQPLSCEGSSSGVYSVSIPIEGSSVSGVPTKSTGPDKAVFPQTLAYRPHNSQFAAVGLLTADEGAIE